MYTCRGKNNGSPGGVCNWVPISRHAGADTGSRQPDIRYDNTVIAALDVVNREAPHRDTVVDQHPIQRDGHHQSAPATDRSPRTGQAVTRRIRRVDIPGVDEITQDPVIK